MSGSSRSGSAESPASRAPRAPARSPDRSLTALADDDAIDTTGVASAESARRGSAAPPHAASARAASAANFLSGVAVLDKQPSTERSGETRPCGTLMPGAATIKEPLARNWGLTHRAGGRQRTVSAVNTARPHRPPEM